MKTNKNNLKTISLIITLFLIIGIIFYNNMGISHRNPLEKQYDLLANPTAQKLFFEQSNSLKDEVDPKLVQLDELNIGCFGPSQVLDMDDNDKNLGGQCCGALKSLHIYEEQVKALEKYKDIPEVPKDPYSILVILAKKLIKYDQDIKLNAEQQKIFNEASKISSEGGPCCCKCWKWYVYSGLAKYLIINYNYNAEQIAELWDISDSCGEHGDHHSSVEKHNIHN